MEVSSASVGGATRNNNRLRGGNLRTHSHPHSRNKQWVAPGVDGQQGQGLGQGQSRSGTSTPAHGHGVDGERWERGGHHGYRGGGGGRGRGGGGGFRSPRRGVRTLDEDVVGEASLPSEDPVLETQEEREKFYQDLVKAREAERKKAIADGKMDDPLVPKRLEDAITMVGTCQDMCPRFERYRRERENNLFEWETIPGTKRVDHKHAVKMYERAAGDKTLPSDLRPPHVLKKTLDYLFHDLLAREGFSPTFNFVRDRSRAVRNDFTMQHEQGELAIECHDRCARFHILALHFERGRREFSTNMEEQQLMNTLQSLKEFYEDQRGSYESPNELEMRVYHRLIHIRDQKERHEDVPEHIREHPVFKLTTDFRLHVQKKSEPIRKNSPLIVDDQAMQIFGQLANVLRDMGNVVMIYLVACILEHLFGKDAIEDIESIRGDLSIPDVIDGISVSEVGEGEGEGEIAHDGLQDGDEGNVDITEVDEIEAAPFAPSASQWQSTNSFGAAASTSAFGIPASTSSTSTSAAPQTGSAFSNLASTSANPFGTQNVFGQSAFGARTSSGPFGGAMNGFSAFAQAAQATSASLSGSSSGSGSAVNGKASTSSPFSNAANAPATEKPYKFGDPPLGERPHEFGNPPIETKSSPFAPSGSALAFPPAAPAASTSSSLPFSVPASSSGFKSLPPSSMLNPQAATFVPSSALAPAPTSTPPRLSFADAPPLSSSEMSLPAAPPAATTNVNSTPLTTASASAPSTSIFSSMNTNTNNTPFTRGFPPTLKLDTSSSTQPEPSTSTPPTSSVPLPRTPLSLEPPPAPKREPISLPPSTPILPQPHPRLEILKGSLVTTGLSAGGSGGEILSPLQLNSPTLSRQGSLGSLQLQNFGPVGTPKVAADKEREKERGREKEREREVFLGEGLFVGHKPPLSPSPLNGSIKRKGKGKGRAVDVDVDVDVGLEGPERVGEEEREEVMVERAKAFERSSGVVRNAFGLWRGKNKERMEYLEAVRHGESYRNRIHKEREKGKGKGKLVNGYGHGHGVRMVSPSEKRRRMSSIGLGLGLGLTAAAEIDGVDGDGDGDVRSPAKKRARRRVSKESKESKEYHVPRTDEELAKRLKENQEEHQRRWAPESFLQVLRTHVKGKATAVASSTGGSSKALTRSWRVWLSLNPEVDGTAIWMENKFGVPEAGEWVSEAVFSIPVVPLSPGAAGNVEKEKGYPGVVVFECTPLEGAGDELERKYRVLDDCTRLRDIVHSLPAKRFFVPSLLMFHWSEGEGSTAPKDLVDMVSLFLDEGLLASLRVFSITASTKDLDTKFGQVLEELKVDVEGRLVRSMSFAGIFKLFDESFNSFVQEWMENCSSIGNLGWGLFGRLMSSVINLLNRMATLVSGLVEKACGTQLPQFPAAEVDDVESMYEVAIQWLSGLSLPQHTNVTADLQAHHDMGKIFPARTFIDNLRDLIQYLAELSIGSASSAVYHLPSSEIESAQQEFAQSVQPHQASLSQALNLRLRRSPKRRSLSNADSPTSSKRVRLSASASASVDSYLSRSPSPNLNSNLGSSPYMNGRASPSPSESSVSIARAVSETPTVTVAMLRALTKDLKAKYGGS